MASIKVKFGQHFMRSFLSRPFDDGDRIYSDPDARGLELRVQGEKAAWVARYAKKTVTIGYAAIKDVKQARSEPRMLTSVAEATQLNGTLRGLIDKDLALIKPFLSSYYAAPDPYDRNLWDAAAAAEAHLAREKIEGEHDNAWTLQECLDTFILDRTAKGANEPLKKNSVDVFLTTFRRPEFAEALTQPVTRLTRAKAEQIRKAVDEKYGASPGIKAVSNLKAVLSHIAEYHTISGLDSKNMWWELVKPLKKIKRKEVTTTITHVGKTLALMEYFLNHRLPKRTGVQHGLRDNIFTGLLWIILTCQRQEAGLSLRIARFVPWDQRDGWYTATWPADVMKGGLRFVLPIPPKMVEVILASRARSQNVEDSKWAFPSEDSPDLHVSRSGTLGMIKRLSARDDFWRQLDIAAKKKAKDEGRPEEEADLPKRIDLLALNEIPYWTPHNVRNISSTFLDLSGIPGGASAILAHAIEIDESKKSQMSEDQHEAWERDAIAKVTRQYSDIQHLRLKAEAMLLWTDSVFQAWEKARNEPLLIDVGKPVVLAELPSKP
ncbi:hypothetical protein ACCS79_03770 [Rhizobium johnstonii]|uniref:hypothetical protein n=1 Tax=Rhizobium johnstonii TaxID=3019933 RepID=UPI003F97B70E